jgi:ribosomal protein S18 acetylase RimI-like enzyme
MVIQKSAPAERLPAREALWRRVRVRLMRGYNRLCRNRNCVYIFDQSSPAPIDAPGLRFERYDRLDLIPEHIHRTKCREVGTTAPDAVAREIDSVAMEMRHGAIYWAAFLDDRLAGIAMSRRGNHFRRWFVPLDERDVVLFRGETFPAFRGRGVHPSRLRHIITQEMRPGGHAYVDCKIYNTTVQRAYEKAGFRKIATAKPLTLKDFFG